MLRRSGRDVHAARAMKFAVLLDHALRVAIIDSWPNANSKKMQDELFEGLKPLRSFSAKINVAYASGIISAEGRRKLHAIRAARNEFAYPTMLLVSFRSRQVIAKLEPFGSCGAKGERAIHVFSQLFADTMAELMQHSPQLAFLVVGRAPVSKSEVVVPKQALRFLSPCPSASPHCRLSAHTTPPMRSSVRGGAPARPTSDRRVRCCRLRYGQGLPPPSRAENACGHPPSRGRSSGSRAR